MPPFLRPVITGSSGSFSVIVAPPGTLLETFSNVINSYQNRSLYLCENYPIFLTKILVDHNKIRIRRALTANQILTILKKANESLILFEHDRIWYQDAPELIPIFGKTCQSKVANSQLIILFSDRVDQWLSQIDPYSSRVIYYIDTLVKPRKNHSHGVDLQNTLEGLW